MVRINPDGSTVDSFNTNLGTGFSSPSPFGQVLSILVINTGKILVGGTFTTFNGNARRGLVLLNDDGTEDTSFYTNLGTGFQYSTNPSFVASISSLNDYTITSQILVAGQFDSLNGNTRIGLMRIMDWVPKY